MRKRKRRRRRPDIPDLTVPQILAWAEAHHARTGSWPKVNSGELYENPHENWRALSQDLRLGLRGLRGGTSLARLLAEKYGVRNHLDLPKLTVEQILAWADRHYARTGLWPHHADGAVDGAPGETWARIQSALQRGVRGLPGKTTLRVLLAEYRGVRNYDRQRKLTVGQILAWADAHKARTGAWPRFDSGPIDGAPGETWAAVASALEQGRRGLPGRSSLPRLLAKHRGVRNPAGLPPLTVEGILAWADAFRERTGRWPTAKSGPIPEAGEETWLRVATALLKGHRGLPGGDSLARLLARFRGARNRLGPPPLTVSRIVQWAREHHRLTGAWPHARSGAVNGVPGESWQAIDNALRDGRRGLPKGLSLARVLAGRAV